MSTTLVLEIVDDEGRKLLSGLLANLGREVAGLRVVAASVHNEIARVESIEEIIFGNAEANNKLSAVEQALGSAF